MDDKAKAGVLILVDQSRNLGSISTNPMEVKSAYSPDSTETGRCFMLFHIGHCSTKIERLSGFFLPFECAVLQNTHVTEDGRKCRSFLFG